MPKQDKSSAIVLFFGAHFAIAIILHSTCLYAVHEAPTTYSADHMNELIENGRFDEYADRYRALILESVGNEAALLYSPCESIAIRAHYDRWAASAERFNARDPDEGPSALFSGFLQGRIRSGVFDDWSSICATKEMSARGGVRFVNLDDTSAKVPWKRAASSGTECLINLYEGKSVSLPASDLESLLGPAKVRHYLAFSSQEDDLHLVIAAYQYSTACKVIALNSDLSIRWFKTLAMQRTTNEPRSTIQLGQSDFVNFIRISVNFHDEFVTVFGLGERIVCIERLAMDDGTRKSALVLDAHEPISKGGAGPTSGAISVDSQ